MVLTEFVFYCKMESVPVMKKGGKEMRISKTELLFVFTAILLFALSFFALEPPKLTGTIEDVQIITKKVIVQGDILGDAIIGGLVLGPVGAVIGAVDAAEKTTEKEIVTACRLLVKNEDGTEMNYTFRYNTGGYGCPAIGDKILLVKYANRVEAQSCKGGGRGCFTGSTDTR